MGAINDAEFGSFKRFIYEVAGITLSDAKKSMVSGRLFKRLQEHRLESYSEYFALLRSGKVEGEIQVAVDLLTTNETYFFREPKHFEFLRKIATKAASASQTMRVWSAASSSGEECYSIAMVLADKMRDIAWNVLGTDISTRVLRRARSGHYSLARTRNIPPSYLKQFCLKGQGEQEGTLLVDRRLRARVNFVHANLNAELPRLGSFDVIFLRNVMIYFNGDTKREVVARVLSLLKPGGYLLIGHSETLNEISSVVEQVAPAIYRKL